MEGLSGLPSHNQFDLGFAQRGQDVLWLFELVDSRVGTARAAFAVRPTSPMQISVDGADCSVGRFPSTLFANRQHSVFEFVLRGRF
jgi:hypothetical protein